MVEAEQAAAAVGRLAQILWWRRSQRRRWRDGLPHDIMQAHAVLLNDELATLESDSDRINSCGGGEASGGVAGWAPRYHASSRGAS